MSVGKANRLGLSTGSAVDDGNPNTRKIVKLKQHTYRKRGKHV